MWGWVKSISDRLYPLPPTFEERAVQLLRSNPEPVSAVLIPLCTETLNMAPHDIRGVHVRGFPRNHVFERSYEHKIGTR